MTTAPGTLDVTMLSGAAAAAAERMPTSSPLSLGDPAPGATFPVLAYAGAVVADVVGRAQERIGLLVGSDLVQALAQSPVPGLTLAAAVQPAVDAAAGALGLTAGEAREVDLGSLAAELGEFTTVPLVGETSTAAFLASDPLISAAPAATTPGFVVDPIGADVVATPVPAPVPVAAAPVVRRGLDLLHGVDMELTVELGRTRMPVRDLLSLAPGDVIELDRAAGAPADLLVNGRLIARGEVVVVDENFGLRITEILESQAG